MSILFFIQYTESSVFFICMHFSILTLFPHFFTAPLSESILKKAQEKNVFSWEAIQIRDFAQNKHKTVDDVPYGGMHGMLMQAEPVAQAITYAKRQYSESEVIFFAPTGKPFTQQVAKEKAENGKDKIFLCGHYEGIDQRVLETMVDETYAVGSAVLTGGEIPALYALDAIVRLLPDAIGKERSHQEESFSDQFFGKGEYPQYTRPEVWNSIRVPKVLLSGNHADIEAWKLNNLQGLSELEKQVLFLKTKVFSREKVTKYRHFWFRLPRPEDAEMWTKEFSDPEVTQFLRISTGITREEELKFLQNDAKDLHSITLSAIDPKTKQVFANTSFCFSEEYPHIATFGLVLHKSHWGKGLGTFITQKMCEIAFEYFPQVHKLQLDVFPENLSARRVYEKVGFQKVGLFKSHQLKDGEYRDLLVYEKMRGEGNG